MATTAYFVLFGQVIGVSFAFTISILVITRLISSHQRIPGLKGRGVLITGCDSGFGHHLAHCLDSEGFVVFAGCLLPEGDGAQSLKKESSSNLRILKLDVTSDEDVQQAKREVQANLPEKGEIVSKADWICSIIRLL